MSDATRIANLEGSLADVAAYLDELRSALASHDAVLGSQRLTELEQRISPSLAAPGVPSAPGSVTGDSALAGLGSAYSTSVAMGGAGLFITDGALTVTNAGSTVVIDGTSDMFKIAATGTQSGAFPSGTFSTTDYDSSITALGNGYSAVPAIQLMVTIYYPPLGAGDVRWGPMWAYPDGTGHIAGMARAGGLLSTGYVTMRLSATNGTTNYYGYTAYSRFHILKEAGI